jgi:hypothetical protein
VIDAGDRRPGYGSRTHAREHHRADDPPPPAPGVGYHWLAGVTTDSAGHVVVLGSFSESIDIAGEVLTTAGKTDIFLAKLAL